MNDLVLLMTGDKKTLRCADLAEARVRAIQSKIVEGSILVELTPAGGGPVETFEFDREAELWISI
jgi:hypothetical protein